MSHHHQQQHHRATTELSPTITRLANKDQRAYHAAAKAAASAALAITTTALNQLESDPEDSDEDGSDGEEYGEEDENGIRRRRRKKRSKNLPEGPTRQEVSIQTDEVVVSHTHDYDRLVDDVARMERTAEYQMSVQKDFYIQQLKQLRSEMETLLVARENELSITKSLLKHSEVEKNKSGEEYVKERAEVNQAWKNILDKKLQEYTLQQERRTTEWKNIKENLEREKAELKKSYEEQIEALKTTHYQQTKELQRKLAEHELLIKETEQQYEEAFTQIESEHDLQVVHLERNQHALQEKTKEGVSILHAEVSAAKKKLEERNEYVKQLEALTNEKEDQLQHLASVIRKLTMDLTGLQKQLREKEENITRRQHDLAQARQDNGTLKNFLEILEHRIAELENRETPALETMLQLKQQVESMSKELFQLNQQKLQAVIRAEQKQGESTRFASAANNLRHKLAKKEHSWESVQKELKYIVEHLGHSHHSKTASGTGAVPMSKVHADLKNLYNNFFSDSSSEAEQPDRTLIEKVENEAGRQRNFLEKSLKRLRHANSSIIVRTKADGEKALAQNINFLYEVNRLREENQRLYQRCGLYRSMVVQAGLGKKLDMIDAGEESQAMQSIQEEQKERTDSQDDSKSGGVKRLMSHSQSEQELTSPSNHYGNHGQLGSLSRSTSTAQLSSSHSVRTLQSSGDSVHQPQPLNGLASSASSSQTQSSAVLPNLATNTKTLRESQSTPAISFVNDGDEVQSRPTTGNTSPFRTLTRKPSQGGLRGKNALTIEGSNQQRPPLEESPSFPPHATKHIQRLADARSPPRTPVSTRVTNQLAHENVNLKVRANELERRLEQVSQHVSLQAVHISALQGAIKSTQQERDEATKVAQQLMNESGLSDEDGGGELDSPSKQSQSLSRTSTGGSNTRPISRGRLAPLKLSPNSGTAASSSTYFAAGASISSPTTPQLELSGRVALPTTNTPSSLNGQNVVTTTQDTTTPAAATATSTSKRSTPSSNSYQSIQQNIATTLTSSNSGSTRSSAAISEWPTDGPDDADSKSQHPPSKSKSKSGPLAFKVEATGKRKSTPQKE